MILGRFTDSEDETLTGFIRSMFFRSDKIVLEPIAAIAENGPTHRLYTSDEIEIGYAYRQIGKHSLQPWFRVVLDDPTFAAPVEARLVRSRAGDAYVLIWERERRAPARSAA